jgi:hypothetical protein
MVVQDWEKTTAVDTTILAVGTAVRRLMRSDMETRCLPLLLPRSSMWFLHAAFLVYFE